LLANTLYGIVERHFGVHTEYREGVEGLRHKDLNQVIELLKKKAIVRKEQIKSPFNHE
jgi:hypothetical protein